jgi:hypothetical protein
VALEGRIMALYSIDLPYGCFGIITDPSDTVVVLVAPMAGWATGKELWKVLSYFRNKRAKIQKEVRDGMWFPIH